MTHTRTRLPRTPRQAARCCGPIDDLLRPGLFRSLSDPTRAKLFACIAKCGRACGVTEVAECCAVDLSVVSRHLRTLEQAGVLESTKDGRTVSYEVRYGTLCRALRGLADAVEAYGPGKQGRCCGGGCRARR